MLNLRTFGDVQSNVYIITDEDVKFESNVLVEAFDLKDFSKNDNSLRCIVFST
jgi:hypothetical protein